MKKFKLLILHPFDPLGLKVGGAETFIKGVIKYSPEDFDIEFIGVTSNKNLLLKKWINYKLGNKEFRFLPLCYVDDENKKMLMPLSLKFVFLWNFSKKYFSDRLVIFNRIELAVLFIKIIIPKILIIHNDIQKQINPTSSEVTWSKFPWLYFMFEKKIFRGLDKIYSVSENTLKFYNDKYPDYKNKFEFLPTWVDTNIFHINEDSKSSIRNKIISINKLLDPNKRWILFVGRLQKQKAPLRLIDTFFEYLKNDKNSCLIIIGEGNLKSDMEFHINKLNIQNNIFFMGNLEQKIIANFYRASDIFLLTSDFEGMPISILEALNCGLPVVSTDVGEVKRIVKNNFSGEIASDFSKESLCQCITKVINNSNNYSESNCTQAVFDYTPEKILKPVYENIRKLYEERFV